jgi:small subunit ribosomal protein S3Ae
MAKKQKKIETKLKRKRWFPIVAPRIFSEQIIGEIFLENPKDLQGRYVSVNLMSLTGDPKKQSINIMFKVVEVRDNKGITEMIGYEMSGASIKRVVRRNRDRVDDSFMITTADGKIVRIKPLVLTKFNTSRAITSSIRKSVRIHIAKTAQATAFEDIVHDIVMNKFQTRIKDSVKKIYPVTSCEVRSLKILSDSGVKPVTVANAEILDDQKPSESPEEKEEGA